MQFPLVQPSSTAQQQNSGQPQAPSLTPVSPVHHIHQSHAAGTATSISSPQHLSPKHEKPGATTAGAAPGFSPVPTLHHHSYHPALSPVTVSPMIEYDKMHHTVHNHHHHSTITAPASYMELFMV